MPKFRPNLRDPGRAKFQGSMADRPTPLSRTFLVLIVGFSDLSGRCEQKAWEGPDGVESELNASNK